jgi:hypothetical protein
LFSGHEWTDTVREIGANSICLGVVGRADYMPIMLRLPCKKDKTKGIQKEGGGSGKKLI